MEWIFQWVKNITYYLVFMSLVSNLLPETRYERYIKLFCGVVFILLVTGPLTAGFKLDRMLARAYRELCFEGDAKDIAGFEERLWELQEEQTERVFVQYEEAVARDIQAMAEEAGLSCRKAQARIERREEEVRYGQVIDVELVMDRGAEAESDAAGRLAGAVGAAAESTVDVAEAAAGSTADAVGAAAGSTADAAEAAVGSGSREGEGWEGGGRVDPVQIRVELGGGRTGIEGAESLQGLPDAGQEGSKEQEAFDGFQRKVAEYYGLEEKAVRITWQDD